MLATGLLLGAVSTYQLARLNLDVGYWDLFWPQFIQGLGLGCIFVPLTTIAMGQVPRKAMGNATSLFNLMRNLGGSVGIASLTMLNTRYQQKYISILGSHVTPTIRRRASGSGVSGRVGDRDRGCPIGKLMPRCSAWWSNKRRCERFLDLFQ